MIRCSVVAHAARCSEQALISSKSGERSSHQAGSELLRRHVTYAHVFLRGSAFRVRKLVRKDLQHVGYISSMLPMCSATASYFSERAAPRGTIVVRNYFMYFGTAEQRRGGNSEVFGC